MVNKKFLHDLQELIKTIDLLVDSETRNNISDISEENDDIDDVVLEVGVEKTNAFVTMIEQIAMERVRLQGGDQRNIPGVSEIIGEEYRIDYNNLKSTVRNFENDCEKAMKVGQCWEYFYTGFMVGISNESPGQLRCVADSFIRKISKEIKAVETYRKLGEENSKEYTDLQNKCLVIHYISRKEFDERIKKYICMRLTTDKANSYADFMNGVDAAGYSGDPLTDYEDVIDNGDAWPESLKRDDE